MGIDAIFNTHNWSVVPFHFWSLCFFVFGCIVGSFLNVCIYRMPLGLSVVSPPSHCPHCKYSIPFYLNVPLVTWLSLGGKCKNCGAKISPRYFIVELLTGLAFLACWLKFGGVDHLFHSMAVAAVYSIFLAGLICATFIDFEHFIIPDEITLGGIAAGFIASFLLPGLHGADSFILGMWRSFLGIIVGAGIVYAILRIGKLLFGRHRIPLPEETKIVFSETHLHFDGKEIPYEEIFYRKSDAIVLHAKTIELVDRGYEDAAVRLTPFSLKIADEDFSPDTVRVMECVGTEIVLPREAMGLGDVKFMAAIGAFVGWTGTIFSLAVSSFIGAAIGVILILLRKREWSSRMPYGPYIALATVIWIFTGPKLMTMLFH
ncbi:MAG TPA: prepilin peptidase [Verrucomicrobiae bacterium]|nr:prepilin peptidase [Verrucomicrobiae bacterium]